MDITGEPGGEFIQTFHALAENASAAAAMLVRVTEEPAGGSLESRPRRTSSPAMLPERADAGPGAGRASDPERDVDLRQLVSTIDGIIDQAHGIADKAILFGLQDRIHGAAELARILRNQTLEIQTAIRAVGRPDRMRESCVAVHRLEVEADGVFQEAMRRLFRQEPDPIRLLKAREILESIHHATDACEDAAQILETLALR
jgi:hypothetical protein